MSEFDDLDFFSDASLVEDPYPHFEYEPTYILRGLHALHLEFTPREAAYGVVAR
jgi:hypothetical protein